MVSRITFNDIMRELDLDSLIHSQAESVYIDNIVLFSSYSLTHDDYADFLSGMKDLPHSFLKELYGRGPNKAGFSEAVLKTLEEDSDPYPDGSKVK